MTRSIFISEILRMKAASEIDVNGEMKDCRLVVPRQMSGGEAEYGGFKKEQMKLWFNECAKQSVTDQEFPKIVDFYLRRVAVGAIRKTFPWESELRKLIADYREVTAIVPVKKKEEPEQFKPKRRSHEMMITCIDCHQVHRADFYCQGVE